ncbi:MAG: MmgE/PrpD family protein [Natronomonas sp.]
MSPPKIVDRLREASDRRAGGESRDEAPVDRDSNHAEPFVERAADWASRLRYADVPPRIREALRALVTSSVGAAAWTLTQPIGEQIVETTHTRAADGTTAVGRVVGDDPPVSFPDGPLPPGAAAYGYAALAAALRFDSRVLGGSVGPSAVFVPLAYAEAADAPGRRTAAGIAAATEVAARLGSAATPGPKRPDPSVVHAAAGAVGCAVVEDADRETTADALAVALGDPTQHLPSASGAPGSCFRASVPLSVGTAAVDAARAGTGGSRTVVEDDLLDSVGSFRIPAFLGGFGDRWHAETVSVKDDPGEASVLPVVEAAKAARGRLPTGRTAVRRVEVEASALTAVADERARSRGGPRRSTVAEVVSTVLRTGEYGPQTAGDTELLDRIAVSIDHSETAATLSAPLPVGELLDCLGVRSLQYVAGFGPTVALRSVPALAGRFRRPRGAAPPESFEDATTRLGARVTVVTEGGRRLVGETDRPSGFAGCPAVERRAVARRKLREGLEALGVDRTTARECVGAAWRFDDETDVLGVLGDRAER